MKKYIQPIVLFLCFHGTLTMVTGQSVEAVTKFSITVSNLEQSVSFYTQVIGFAKISEYKLDSAITQHLFGFQTNRISTRIAVLQLGDEVIELMEFSDAVTGRSIPHDSRSNDLWFQHIAIVVSDMDAAYQKVYEAGVQHVSTSPQTLPDYIPAAAGITAFYFRDPDGHNLELIHFPEGKGNPKWKAYEEGELFLGIDHTAIGVDQTKRGFAFYSQLLDLGVGGDSENYGSEQEHLNQVFGARLLITGLYPDQGPGIEFLDYIAPPGGRAYPEDSTPADLWHWHTTIQVDQLDKLHEKLKGAGIKIISTGIVEYDQLRAILVRDHDGHAILLTSQKENSIR